MANHKKEYVGDGVYIEGEGGYIILTTENGIAITNTIYLEPPVLRDLLAILKRWGEIK